MLNKATGLALSALDTSANGKNWPNFRVFVTGGRIHAEYCSIGWRGAPWALQPPSAHSHSRRATGQAQQRSGITDIRANVDEQLAKRQLTDLPSELRRPPVLERTHGPVVVELMFRRRQEVHGLSPLCQLQHARGIVLRCFRF